MHPRPPQLTHVYRKRVSHKFVPQTQVYDLLSNNYVEDDDAMFR